MVDSVINFVACGLSAAVVTLAWSCHRHHRWQIRRVAQWANSASPRYDLSPPPPDLGPDELAWAIGFKRWSQRLQRDLVELRSRRELAAQTGQQTERFHARLRHDLRTPLNAMIGFSDLLLQGIDGPLGDEEQQNVESISASSRMLHRRVEEVLSDSIGIALVDHPEENDAPPSLRPSLRPSERPALNYPSSSRWLVHVHWRTCLVLAAIVAGLAILLAVVGQWSVALVCAVSLVAAYVLCGPVRRETGQIEKQASALRSAAKDYPTSIEVFDAALRSYKHRVNDSRERENTAAHFLADRDRRRNQRIARSAATLRAPLEEVRNRTAQLTRRTTLNQKQRDSLAHVLRSANLLNMALEELFLLVDYEGEQIKAQMHWVPTVELLTQSVARLRHAVGDDTSIDIVVMPGIAPVWVDPTHFVVAFAGLLRFIIKRDEGAGVSVVASFDSTQVSIHFQEERLERHDTIPGRREQELSVLNSGPKLMTLVMDNVEGRCRYQLEGILEGWLVFPRREMRELS